jgi:hypothetical protein
VEKPGIWRADTVRDDRVGAAELGVGAGDFLMFGETRGLRQLGLDIKKLARHNTRLGIFWDSGRVDQLVRSQL